MRTVWVTPNKSNSLTSHTQRVTCQVDMRSKVKDQLPYNPVVEQVDLILKQLEMQGGLFAVGQEKAQV